jgi:hypothetical protein
MLLFTGLDFASNPLFLRIREPSRSVSEFPVLRSVVGNMIRSCCPAPNHVGIVPALPTLERFVRNPKPDWSDTTDLFRSTTRRCADPEHNTFIGGLSPYVGSTASRSRVTRASASSSGPRTACRPSRRPYRLSGSQRAYGPLLARRGEEPRAWAVCRFVARFADNPHADDYKALMGRRPRCRSAIASGTR